MSFLKRVMKLLMWPLTWPLNVLGWMFLGLRFKRIWVCASLYAALADINPLDSEPEKLQAVVEHLGGLIFKDPNKLTLRTITLPMMPGWINWDPKLIQRYREFIHNHRQSTYQPAKDMNAWILEHAKESLPGWLHYRDSVMYSDLRWVLFFVTILKFNLPRYPKEDDDVDYAR